MSDLITKIYASQDWVKKCLDDKITAPESAIVGQTVVVKTVDENGKPTEWEAANVPEHTWATLSDKPTETIPGLSIEWDGNTNGLSYFYDWIKVSDDVLTMKDFENGCTVVIKGGTRFDFTKDDIQCSDFFHFGFDTISPKMAPFFMVFPGGSCDPGGNPIEEGVYFLFQSGSVCLSLTFPDKEVIKPELILPLFTNVAEVGA